MGSKMDKKTVIYGEKHAIALDKFDASKLNEVVKVIHDLAGPVTIDMVQAKAAVQRAHDNKKMKDTAYVKVGVVKGHLVLRCKEKKFLGDIEEDGILVKNWDACVAKWDKEKLLHDVDKVLNDAPSIVEKKEDKKEEWSLGDSRRGSNAPKMMMGSAQRRGSVGSSSDSTTTESESTTDSDSDESSSEDRVNRLREVMERTPEGGGESVADRIRRGVEKVNKLGIAPGAKERMEKQGLHPMQEAYHGEVFDHQKNRYGGYLKQLQGLWEKHASNECNLSEWLDLVEDNDTRMAGVKEGRAFLELYVRKDSDQKVKDTFGEVTYLDDKTRGDYEATLTKGKIRGKKIGSSGEFIFVVGPDSKVYAGKKNRASEGESGAFNHSSFFSGGAVKSAGTIKVEGGRITEVLDVSGHYKPDASMIRLACTRFSSGDRECLRYIKVKCGSVNCTASEFLGVESKEEVEAEIAKKIVDVVDRVKKHPAYHGKVDAKGAERLLATSKPGIWIFREGTRGMAVSRRKEDGVTHSTFGVNIPYLEVEEFLEHGSGTMLKKG